ncbi:MAG: PaaI family thioesterase [Oscillospiraceae bacterium]|nr:PaaI family thioesterase [Oscillospiraceae bacterium]
MPMDNERLSQLQEGCSRGLNAYCGLEVLDIDSEHCVLLSRLRPELRNPAGIAHGGAIATLMDMASIYVAVEADNARHLITTQSANIHYLRPVAGDSLRAEARVIRKGRRVCVVQVDCFNDDGSHAVTAIFEISYLDAPLNPA